MALFYEPIKSDYLNPPEDDIDESSNDDIDSEDDIDIPKDSAVVRYSCLDCDFPKMDQICPEVENRKGIHLRVEYNGYKNTTVDGKPCLNWMQVRPTRNLRTKTFIRKSSGPWRPDKGDIKTG